ncbi:hypothetical protein Hypma_009379 [Hypsizygus marmoreus]|uniref:Uncharacterized protein n=1 Tax=Hypsizygus marmoreus TaxID=39966 RepID=A0A369JVQ7_HYPMA|nr:hypothetical protein Hypma_009379 [Hypsizygus marmoreus]
MAYQHLNASYHSYHVLDAISNDEDGLKALRRHHRVVDSTSTEDNGVKASFHNHHVLATTSNGEDGPKPKTHTTNDMPSMPLATTTTRRDRNLGLQPQPPPRHE